MEITISKLENVKEIKTISAISVFGIGFLTLIISCFVELFGIENKRLVEKIEKAKERTIQSLILQAEATPNADGIMNLSFQMSGKSVLAYGTVFQNYKDAGVGSSDSNIADEIPEI